MKLKYPFFLTVPFLLISNTIYAEKQNTQEDLYSGIKKDIGDPDRPFQVKLNEYNAYFSTGEEANADQDDSEEIAIKDPDKTSPYFEVGLRKKY